MTKRMTNFDKFRMIEINGARIFEHQNKEAAVEILGCMACEDCPVSDECEGDSRCCDEMLAEWLNKETEE